MEATLPTASDSAKQVLASLLVESAWIPIVGRIAPAKCYADKCDAATMATFARMASRGEPIDPVSVRLQLEAHPAFSGQYVPGYIATLMEVRPIVRNVEYHAGIVAEAARKRRLHLAAVDFAADALNGQSSSELLANFGAFIDDERREADPSAKEIESYTLADFMRLDMRQDFIINGVVTEAQGGCVSAKSKTNKTNLSLAMSVSASTGLPFLEHYEVPEPVPCGFISAESGGATLQDSFRRVCHSVGKLPHEISNLQISTRLPLLTTAEGRDQLERYIVKYGLRALWVDPTYMAFAGVDDTQLSQMAVHLRPISEIIDRTRCSIIMVHHNRKSPARQGEHYAEPTQDDIQGTGFQQWARFFVLLNKRREWEPNEGRHWLWFKTEGSAGFGSRYHLNLVEGRRSDPGGRVWDVELVEPFEGAEQERDDREATKEAAKLDGERRAVCDVLASRPGGLSWSKALRLAKVSNRRWEIVKEVMVDEVDVIECEVTVSNQKTPIQGIRLATAEVA